MSGDGHTVAAGTSHGSDVRLFDVRTGKQVESFSAGPGWVHKVAFSPDGQTLAWATAQHLIHLRDLPHHHIRHTLRGHQYEVSGVAWAPDGKTLLSGGSDGQIKLWNPATGKERLSLRAEAVTSLAVSPDGRSLFVGHKSSKVMLYQLTPQRAWASFEGPTGFNAVGVLPDKNTLAAATREKTVRLWDLATRKDRALHLGDGLATSLAFLPAGGQGGSAPALLAVGVQACSKDGLQLLPGGECQLWDVTADKRLATLKGKGRAVHAVAFSPDGRELLGGDGAGRVWVWEVAGRKVVADLGPHAGPVLALAVSADGKTLASAGGHEVKLWDLPQRRELATLKGHTAEVTGLAFLNDGQTLASAGKDRSVKLWDVADRKLRVALPSQPEAVLALAVSKDGQTLALACQDRTVKLWDVTSKQLRAVLPGHTREVTALSFGPDGRTLVSASAANSNWWVKGGEVKVWKADR